MLMCEKETNQLIGPKLFATNYSPHPTSLICREGTSTLIAMPCTLSRRLAYPYVFQAYIP